MEKKHILAGTVTGIALMGALAGALSAQQTASAAEFSVEQAIEIALLEVPGEVQEVEREREEGVTVFEVEILDETGQEFEIKIAAETGAILAVDVDGPADDESDHDDDDDSEDDD